MSQQEIDKEREAIQQYTKELLSDMDKADKFFKKVLQFCNTNDENNNG